jgi:SAM-dependent methyltransferase
MPSLKSQLYQQFGNPTGPLGALAGLVMANRDSNRRRNAWTVRQLDIQPDDRVLEVGFGPGLAIRDAAAMARDGRVVGIDRSATMQRQAHRRNRDAVADGRVELRLGEPGDLLGDYGRTFQKALAVNVFPFWTDSIAVLRQIGQLLSPGARIALTVQPRGSAATNDQARVVAARMVDALHAAGFAEVETRTLPLQPVNAVCALGTLPR